MARLQAKYDIRDCVRLIESTNDEILTRLMEMRLTQLHAVDVPQFPRGSELPKTINVEPIQPDLRTVLNQAIMPQPVHSQMIALPKRMAGIVQLQASEHEYQQLMELVEFNSQTRKSFFGQLKAAEPNERKRASLSKKLFPDVLVQTVFRKIPLSPFNTHSLKLSWCQSQNSLRKLSQTDVGELSRQLQRSMEKWKYNEIAEKLAHISTLYKHTNVRVHPQAVVGYTHNGKKRHISKKVHSPIIVLTESETPITYTQLENHTQSDDTVTELLVDYDTLIPGSCYVYKTAT
ncbi:DNA replication terminus site-binding protein [Vibrio mediterranei]